MSTFPSISKLFTRSWFRSHSIESHRSDVDHSESVELNKFVTSDDDTVVDGLDSDGNVIDETKKIQRSPFHLAKGRRGTSAFALFCPTNFEVEDFVSLEIFNCIRKSNTVVLTSILEGFTTKEIDKLTVAGQPIIHLICWKGDLKSLKVLISHNVQIDQVNTEGVTALHLAVYLGWSEGVSQLLCNGANPDVFPDTKSDSNYPWKELPIHTACRNGDYSIVYQLLEKRPDLTISNFEGNLALHLAAFSNNSDLIQLLIEDKIVQDTISSQNEKGNTPLHMLMLGKNTDNYQKDIADSVKLFFKHGVDIDAVNSLGRTALFLAAKANLPIVVRTLLELSANTLLVAYDGRNVLHAACSSGSSESLSLLLQDDKNKHMVLRTDCKELAPFHSAVSSYSIDCCELLLENGDHLANTDYMGRNRSTLVLKNMPSAIQLLKNVFDKQVKISDKDVNDPEFSIEMDFNVILSKYSNELDNSFVSDFCGSYTESLLKHPLIESFLFLEWQKIKFFFYMYVLSYFIFLIIHTYYIIMTYNMKVDWSIQPVLLGVIHWLHAALLITLLVPGVISMVVNVREYIRQWETYFKIFALLNASFVVFANSDLYSKEIARSVASTSIFFTWVEFMMLLGRFPALGVYILMFTKVAKSVLLFLLAFSPLIVAFSLSFSIILGDVVPFDNIPVVFVRTLMMMIGEIDFSDIYEVISKVDPVTKYVGIIFLVVFVVLMPILMTNLLIGLAVSDIPDLQLQGKIRRLVKEASYLETYERLMFFFINIPIVSILIKKILIQKGPIKRIITIRPNQRHRKFSVSIPLDVIAEAKISGTRENAKTPFDLSSAFKCFCKEYKKDRERIEDALETLYEMTMQQMKQPSEDVVDGAVDENQFSSCLFSKRARRHLAY